MAILKKLIAAIDEERGFGRAGGIPWSHPADMAHFKAATMGSAVAIGRITWESIRRPLPGRLVLVVTSRPEPVMPSGVVTVGSWGEALRVAEDGRYGSIWAAGGVGIYQAAIDGGLDEALVTRVPDTHGCDVFLPELKGVALVRTTISGDLEFDRYARS